MLRSVAFWAGLGAGALVTWMVARRRGQGLIVAAPYYPKPLSRRARRGGSWPGQANAYNR